MIRIGNNNLKIGRLVLILFLILLYSPFPDGLYSEPVSMPALSNDLPTILPVLFIENRGQMDSSVEYFIKTPLNNFYLTQEGITFQSFIRTPDPSQRPQHIPQSNQASKGSIKGENIQIVFQGKNSSTQICGLEKARTRFNFFLGNDSSEWTADVPSFKKVLYRDLYPSIDMIVSAEEGNLKLEYRIRPGGNVSDIQLRYEGISKLELNHHGDLLIGTEIGQFVEDRPLSYQERLGQRTEIKCDFVIESENSIRFETGPYERNTELVIDPVLRYSTFLGGSDEELGWVVAVDDYGQAYVTGETYSLDFPTTVGSFDRTFSGDGDIFVFKIDSSGSNLLYSTFLGGANDHPDGVEGADGIAVDSAGNVYLTGWTSATDFPTTPGAFDSSFNGGGPEFQVDAFVTKIDSSGSSLIFSTYLGGERDEWGNGLAIDDSSNVYVVGVTYSTNFPTTTAVFDRSHNGGVGDAFVTKLNPTGTGLTYSTFIGGSEWEEGGSIAVDSEGKAYISGYTESSDFPVTPGALSTNFNGGDSDGFVSKLSVDGSSLVYSTFLGGSGEDGCDLDGGDGILVDPQGNVYVSGETKSSNFPATLGVFDTTFNGRWDGFVTKLNPDASGIVFSTFLGGSHNDRCSGIVAGPGGGVFVIGDTESPDFPVTPDALDGSYNGKQDVFAAQLNSSGTQLIYSTYIGGQDIDECDGLALDRTGGLYVTGWTKSADFPTTAGAFDTSQNGDVDVFVLKIEFASFRISGAVRTGQGEGIEGVSVVFSNGGGSGTTYSEENYTHPVVEGWSGVVIPSKPGYSFTPSSRSYSNVNSEIAAQDYLGEQEDLVVQPPLGFTVRRVGNRSLFQVELINVLQWSSNPANAQVTAYRIYIDSPDGLILLVELKAVDFLYLHRGISSDRSYKYAITAVNSLGNESIPTYATVH